MIAEVIKCMGLIALFFLVSQAEASMATFAPSHLKPLAAIGQYFRNRNVSYPIGSISLAGYSEDWFPYLICVFGCTMFGVICCVSYYIVRREEMHSVIVNVDCQRRIEHIKLLRNIAELRDRLEERLAPDRRINVYRAIGVLQGVLLQMQYTHIHDLSSQKIHRAQRVLRRVWYGLELAHFAYRYSRHNSLYDEDPYHIVAYYHEMRRSLCDLQQHLDKAKRLHTYAHAWL